MFISGLLSRARQHVAVGVQRNGYGSVSKKLLANVRMHALYRVPKPERDGYEQRKIFGEV